MASSGTNAATYMLATPAVGAIVNVSGDTTVDARFTF